MGGIPGRISGRPRETIRAVGAIAESPAEPGSHPTSGPFVNGPYGETWVSAVGAGVLDSPAGKSEKMQTSPANADFDPFSPEIPFRFPLFIDLRLSLHGRGSKGLSSRRKPRPYGADGELRRGGYQPPVEIGQRPTSGRVIPAPTQHGPRSPVGTTIGRPQTCAHVRQTDEQCSSLRSGRTSGSSGRRPLRGDAGLRCRGWRPRQPGGKT